MTTTPPSGSHVFILRALKELSRLASSGPFTLAQPKRIQKLKEMCSALLEKCEKGPQAFVQESSFPLEEAALVMHHGCQCAQVDIAKVCLDTVQKMISYGHMSNLKSKDSIIKDGVVGCLIPSAEVQLQVIKALVAAVTHDVVHGEALGSAVSCVFDLCVSGKSTEVRTTARTIVTQMVNTIYNRLEAGYSATLSVTHSNTTPQHPPPSSYEEAKQQELAAALQVNLLDAAATFIFFCQQADPDAIEPHMAFDSREVMMVQISLDFVGKILKGSGPAFRGAETLLATVQDSLLSCVVKGALSARIEICKPCLEIVIVLLSEFKHYLRVEVGLLFTTIIFRLLKSPNIAVSHKISVLRAIVPLVSTGHILVDVFVNYDCDVEGINLFEGLLDILCHVAQTSLVPEDGMITQKDDYHIRYLAIQSIVSVLRSLVYWLASQGRQGAATQRQAEGSPTPAMLEAQRHWKRNVARAVDLFNKKPKKGVEFLMETDLIEKTSAGVARFLSVTKGLEAEMVSEFLSEADKFNTEVMECYCSSMDFKGMTLDDSLRKFVQRFKLPKEGQKIERVLEYFTSHWYRLNKEIPSISMGLDNPDAPYVIAVAIVMLNTDLHNPQVKKKMSLDQFCGQLRGVNGGRDLPRGLLEDMYRRIESRPMILDEIAHDDHETSSSVTTKQRGRASSTFISTSLEKVTGGDVFVSKQDRKVQKHNTEMEKILAMACHGLTAVTKSSTAYFMAADVEHVKPMFGATWSNVLQAVSSQLEAATTKEMAMLCLEGYDLSIHIAVVFDMEAEREAFIGSLSKLTYLDGSKPILTKNVLCMKQLLKTSLQDGDNLRSGWVTVFKILSQIDRLQFDEEKIRKGYHDMDIHKVFAHSVSLTDCGIRDFLCSLCEVARLEVGAEKPRMYCLQKVVEVAAENVGSRLVPAWHSMSSLMVEVGCHANEAVAHYGVDSLRQLISKLIDDPSLLACELQPELLLPYRHIMASPVASHTVQDFVLTCVMNMIVLKGVVLGKGWGIVLRALSVVPGHPDQSIVRRAFECLTHLMDNCQEQLAPYITELLHTITLFAAGTTGPPSLSLEAVGLLEGVLSKVSGCEEPYWSTALANYCLLMSDSRPDIRSRSVDRLTAMLQRTGWQGAYRFIGDYIIASCKSTSLQSTHETSLRAMMQCRESSAPLTTTTLFLKCEEGKAWVTTTGVALFALLRTTLVESFEVPDISQSLDSVLYTLSQCALQDDESVIQSSLECLMALIRTSGEKLQTQNHWRSVVDHCISLILPHCRVRPSQLLPFASESMSIEAPPDDPIEEHPIPQSASFIPPYYVDEAHLSTALTMTSLRQQHLLPVLEWAIVGRCLPSEGDSEAFLHSLLACATAADFFFHPMLQSFRSHQPEGLLRRMTGRLRASYGSYFRLCLGSLPNNKWGGWVRIAHGVGHKYLSEVGDTVALGHIVAQLLNDVCHYVEDDATFAAIMERGQLYSLCLDLVASPSPETRKEVVRALKKHYAVMMGQRGGTGQSPRLLGPPEGSSSSDVVVGVGMPVVGSPPSLDFAQGGEDEK